MVSCHETLKAGGIIAYPTEAVFGLGCDFTNEAAVLRILKLKQRRIELGLIVIASCWEQVAHLATPLSHKQLQLLQQSWPGPTTWLLPASQHAPNWITGKHNSIAIRISAHPIAQEICQNFNGGIVSTSANISGQSSARSVAEVVDIFGDKIDLIIPGDTDELASPSKIIDLLTKTIIRE